MLEVVKREPVDNWTVKTEDISECPAGEGGWASMIGLQPVKQEPVDCTQECLVEDQTIQTVNVSENSTDENCQESTFDGCTKLYAKNIVKNRHRFTKWAIVSIHNLIWLHISSDGWHWLIFNACTVEKISSLLMNRGRGIFWPPCTECYSFENNNTTLVKFDKLVRNMARKRMTVEKTTWNLPIDLEIQGQMKRTILFKMKLYHISSCICAIKKISMYSSTLYRPESTIMLRILA